ncbi:hypothetical protein QYM36_006840 [Artemia franciscana]|uniref:Secreted protein n=1 Tax=Artemia franciscana TaxID=6661 RepID=A0AA88L4K1_ARTSF|nr:hypothetical protein QYM36_006840 [Artemia franciscana]
MLRWLWDLLQTLSVAAAQINCDFHPSSHDRLRFRGRPHIQWKESPRKFLKIENITIDEARFLDTNRFAWRSEVAMLSALSTMRQ